MTDRKIYLPILTLVIGLLFLFIFGDYQDSRRFINVLAVLMILNSILILPYRLSAKYFYDSIGIKKYKSIDIDGVYDSLKFDLNYILKEKYKYFEKFDIVTNLGTSEHVFNQKSCFENIHNLCGIDGLMIHLLPINGFENHCFFNYHFLFFKHLSEVNNYEILFVDYYSTTYYLENDSEYIIIILKKTNDLAFINPLQKSINDKRFKIDKFKIDCYAERFKKIMNLDFFSINNVAIFGTALAGAEAYSFLVKNEKNIICFIDDFNFGFYDNTNIPVISFNEFKENYEQKVDLIIQGNNQKGDISSRNISIPVLELSKLIY